MRQARPRHEVILDTTPPRILVAEMKLPGEARLAFRIDDRPPGRTELQLLVRFRLRGIGGLAYGYAVGPSPNLSSVACSPASPHVAAAESSPTRGVSAEDRGCVTNLRGNTGILDSGTLFPPDQRVR